MVCSDCRTRRVYKQVLETDHKWNGFIFFSHYSFFVVKTTGTLWARISGFGSVVLCPFPWKHKAWRAHSHWHLLSPVDLDALSETAQIHESLPAVTTGCGSFVTPTEISDRNDKSGTSTYNATCCTPAAYIAAWRLANQSSYRWVHESTILMSNNPFEL